MKSDRGIINEIPALLTTAWGWLLSITISTRETLTMILPFWGSVTHAAAFIFGAEVWA